jgi:hypothetical protein
MQCHIIPHRPIAQQKRGRGPQSGMLDTTRLITCRDRFQLRRYPVEQPTKGVFDAFKPTWLTKQFGWYDTSERWHFSKEPAGQEINGVKLRIRYETAHVIDELCERRIDDTT